MLFLVCLGALVLGQVAIFGEDLLVSLPSKSDAKLVIHDEREEGIALPAVEFISAAEEEYKDKFANPYTAAQFGYIDDVIEPRNTRFRVIRALQALATKKDVMPARKHTNIPL